MPDIGKVRIQFRAAMKSALGCSPVPFVIKLDRGAGRCKLRARSRPTLSDLRRLSSASAQTSGGKIALHAPERIVKTQTGVSWRI